VSFAATSPRDARAVAPPGFCNRGGSEVWVYRGSRVRSPPSPGCIVCVCQRGSLLDGLAMYLSCDTMKFHDNESTHILHNFWTSTHRGGASPSLPPWRRHCMRVSRGRTSHAVGRRSPTGGGGAAELLMRCLWSDTANRFSLRQHAPHYRRAFRDHPLRRICPAVGT